MKVLDLYCCDGGASVGLFNAGFTEIVGVDIDPHPNYPFDFIQADCLNLPIKDFSDFDFIWASPPCQGYTWSTVTWRNKGKEYPDLVSATRELLKKIHKPYVIENVMEAPIKKDLLLCGQMFNLNIYRHRKFEISGFRVEQPVHRSHIGSVHTLKKQAVYTGGDGVGGYGGNVSKRKRARALMKRMVTVAGHGGDGSAKLKEWQDAMRIHWTSNKKYLAEAVPPAYSEYIGKEFFRTYKH